LALITDRDVADIKSALEELAPYTEEPITYKQYSHTNTGDPVQGISAEPVYVEDPDTTSANVEALSVEEIAVSGGRYVLGDMLFTVRRNTEPSYQDRIVYDGATWKPKSIGKMFLREVLWWEIRAGKE